jgi:hypothetical protein
VENAAGSGGSREEPGGGGVESNRSDSSSCVTGAFSSESRRADDGARVLASRRGVASAGVMAGGVSTSDSGLNGISSAIGSTSSVISLPP